MDRETVCAIVPNTVPCNVIVFGTEWSARLAVIAWFVEGRYADPITCESVTDDDIYCIEQHLGGVTYIFPEDRSFDTFDEAEAYGYERVKEREERRARKHAKTTP